MQAGSLCQRPAPVGRDMAAHMTAVGLGLAFQANSQPHLPPASPQPASQQLLQAATADTSPAHLAQVGAHHDGLAAQLLNLLRHLLGCRSRGDARSAGHLACRTALRCRPCAGLCKRLASRHPAGQAAYPARRRNK